MGKKNLNDDFDNDEMLFSDDFDVESFEQENYEKDSHRSKRRKMHRRAALRNRFTDVEEDRWLKRQVRDWEYYGTNYDTDEEDFHHYKLD